MPNEKDRAEWADSIRQLMTQEAPESVSLDLNAVRPRGEPIQEPAYGSTVNQLEGRRLRERRAASDTEMEQTIQSMRRVMEARPDGPPRFTHAREARPAAGLMFLDDTLPAAGQGFRRGELNVITSAPRTPGRSSFWQQAGQASYMDLEGDLEHMTRQIATSMGIPRAMLEREPMLVHDEMVLKVIKQRTPNTPTRTAYDHILGDDHEGLLQRKAGRDPRG